MNRRDHFRAFATVQYHDQPGVRFGGTLADGPDELLPKCPRGGGAYMKEEARKFLDASRRFLEAGPS